ncbi:MAG: DUF4357 domain-containing protein [Victivallaceae bacterium]|nr:DUF4357 domain-containing protein [Victivallaceae bacterium]
MKPKIDPLFLSNSKGEKIAVLLKLEEFEQIMEQLEPAEAVPEPKVTHKKVKVEVVSEKEKTKKSSKNTNTKLVFGKTEAELEFEKSEAAMELEKSEAEAETKIKPNNFYTKSIIHEPVAFEMQDEFCSAKGVLLPDGRNFKVLRGSKASGIVDKKLSDDICYLREELKMLQVLVKDTARGDMIFTRDYEFDNPTDAASTIAASPRDGGHYWIASENGKPMRQY